MKIVNPNKPNAVLHIYIVQECHKNMNDAKKKKERLTTRVDHEHRKCKKKLYKKNWDIGSVVY